MAQKTGDKRNALNSMAEGMERLRVASSPLWDCQSELEAALDPFIEGGANQKPKVEKELKKVVSQIDRIRANMQKTYFALATLEKKIKSQRF